jgi:hypothetical protein
MTTAIEAHARVSSAGRFFIHSLQGFKNHVRSGRLFQLRWTRSNALVARKLTQLTPSATWALL